jgi:hypothetical protein
VVKDEDADCRGKARIALAGIVDFGRKLVDGEVSRFGYGAEGIPEFGFQGHAGAVTVEGERAFGGAGGHDFNRYAQRQVLSPEFSKTPVRTL